MDDQRGTLFVANFEGKFRIVQSNVQPIRTRILIWKAEAVFFDKIVNSDLPFVFLVGGAAPDRGFIERDRDETIASLRIGFAHSLYGVSRI